MEQFSFHFVYRKSDLFQMNVMFFFFLVKLNRLKWLEFLFRVHYVELFMQIFVEIDESFEILLHLLFDIVLKFKISL